MANEVVLSELCLLPLHKEKKHEVEDAIARMGLTGKILLYHITFNVNGQILPTEHLACKLIDEKLIFVYSLKGWNALADEIIAEVNREESASVGREISISYYTE